MPVPSPESTDAFDASWGVPTTSFVPGGSGTSKRIR